ncbi:MAG: MBG domain-containing protein [Kiritimatiellia bacterium]
MTGLWISLGSSAGRSKPRRFPHLWVALLGFALLVAGRSPAMAQMVESFEYGVPPPGWIKTNLLGGSGWYQLPIGVAPLPGWGNGTSSVPAAAYAGTHNAYCTWSTGGSASEGYHSDQWLISPRMTGLTATSTVSYWLRFAFTNYPDEVRFRVSTTGPAPANFTTVAYTSIFAKASYPNQFPPWSNIVVNVGALGIPAGTPIWIAIQEYVWDNTWNGAAVQLDVIASDLTVPPQPRVGPTSLTFTAYYEGADPAAQTFAIQSVGSSGMSFSSQPVFGAGPTNWLTIGGPPTGTLPLQQSQTYTAAVSVAGLDLGTYVATNVFNVPGATNNPLRVPITLRVIRRPQTITFPNPGPQTTTNQVGLAGTASSGLPVTFSVFSGPGVVAGATNLSFTGTGTVRVVSWQLGNAYYDVAPCVTQAMAVAKAEATILFSDLSQPYDGAPRAPTVETLPPGLTVEMTYDGGPSLPIARGSYAATGVVNEVLYAGTAATTFTIVQGVQSIEFPAIAPQKVSAGVGLAAAGGGSGNPVTFRVESGPGSIADGTNLSFGGVGDVVVVASQAGDADYEAAPDATNVVKVFGLAPADGPFVGGNAVAVTNGNFGTITNVLVGGVAAGVDQTSAAGFTLTLPAGAVTGLVDLVVQTEANGEIMLPEAYSYNAAGVIGDVAPATSSWTGGYEVVILGTNLCDGTDVTNVTLCGVSVASIDSRSATQVVVTAGAAAVAGIGDVRTFSTSFGEAVKSNAFEYLRDEQAPLTFAPASPQAYGATNALSVSGGSGTGAVSYVVLSGAGTIVGDTNLAVTAGSGTIEIRATKAQDDHYAEASATGTVAAIKAPATVELASLAQTYDGTPKAATATTVPEGLTVAFTYDGSETAPAAAGSYAVTGTVVDANWQGEATGTLVITLITNSLTVGSLYGTPTPATGTIWHVQGAWIDASVDASVLSADMATQHVCVGWSGTGSVPEQGASNAVSFTVTNNSTLVWNWITEYDLTINPDINGSVDLPNGWYVASTNLSITATPADGYEFAGWTGDVVTNANPLNLTMDRAYNLTPTFTQITNSLTVDSLYGTPTPDTGTTWHVQGAWIDALVDAAVLSPDMATQHVCVGWSGTGSVPEQGASNAVSFTITNHSTLVWNWITEYDLTINPDINGSVNLPNGWYVASTNLSITATPADGYEFAGWTGDVVTNANPLNLIMDQAYNLTPVFKTSQSIAFAPIPPQKPSASVGLAATGGGSGQPVVFAVTDGPGTISGDTNLSFTGVGDVVVVASQAGDADYAAAPDVTDVVKVFGVTPDNGPFAGGNAVTVSNGNFGTVTNILIGGAAATIQDSGTSWFTIVMPAIGAAETVDIVVQASNEGDLTLPGAYTVNLAGQIGWTEYGPTIWTNLAEGLNDGVAALAWDGERLYAGGAFTESGGVSAPHVAAWNGTNWSSLGGGLNGEVGALAHAGAILYAGGLFTEAGGAAANHVAMWNGAAWTNLGPGLDGGVMALAHDGTRLIAGCNDGSVAMWDGASWTNCNGISSTVWALLHTGADLYAGSSQSGYALRWNGSDWLDLGDGVDSQVNALAQDGANLYAGGWFTSAGGVAANGVGLWNGASWTNLGDGVMGPYGPVVLALTHDGTRLHAGGVFTNAGGLVAENVAAWNGEAWTNLGSGLNGVVQALAGDGLNLYAGGAFTHSGAQAARNVAKWGPAWIDEFPGVVPSGGSWTGGYEVVIRGTNLCDGADITNVTLCGVAVASIDSRSATQVVVRAGAAAAAGTGDVRTFSASFGETVKSNAFEYLRDKQVPLVFAPASPQAYGTTNALSLSGGSGTGAVSFVVLSGPGLIAGDTNLVVTAGSGTIEIRATKAQDDLYAEASATGTVTAIKATAEVHLQDLAHTYDGTAKSATATTDPTGLTVDFTYEGSVTAPSDAGSYAVTGTVADANYEGSAAGTLTIGRADQSISNFLPTNGSVFLMSDSIGLSATASSGLEVRFASTGGPAVLEGTNLTFSSGGEVVVFAMQAGNANWNAAPPVANAYSVLGIYSIAVESPHGTAVPGTGAFAQVQGTVFTNRIESPDTQGTTQYVCIGWTLDGHDPAGGSETQMAMTVTNDATLTWLWTTNYQLTTASGGNGSVQPESGWVAAGVATQILAVADRYFVFTNWTGDASGDGNPLAMTMDAAKSVTANFAAIYTTNRPTPEWWLAEHGITNDFETAVDEDPDGDGISTGDEWVMDTDPTNGASFLAFDAIEPVYGSNCWEVVWTNEEPPYDVWTNVECEIIGHVYQWPASTGRLYGVQGAAGMLAPWLDLEGMTNLQSQGPKLLLTNSAMDADRMRHYRIRVRVP